MDPSGSPHEIGGASHANPPQKPPTCDVKPRLTKEQHDVLEQHFQVQHKPSTLVKKDFASKLGVPLDKVNVSSSSPPVLCNSRANFDGRTGFRTAEQRSNRTARRSPTR